METLKVFISGTQDDMQPERDAISRAVDSVVIATGIRAERTLSSPQSPLHWINEQIQSCNIYLGIYSHRYGWVIPEERISATEYEFDQAQRLGRPILVWVRKQLDSEKDLPNHHLQQQFLHRVSDFSSGYLRQEFANPADLEKWVADALSETFIKIIKRETTRPYHRPAWPNQSFVEAYLRQIAAQKPFVLWNEQTYLHRSVIKKEDVLAPTANRERIMIESLEDALKREGKLVLLGEPGMGKTTCLQHFAWKAANQAFRQSLSENRELEIPLYVELKNYNGEEELETLITSQINKTLRLCRLMLAPDLAESTRILTNWIVQSKHKFLFLIDGLNEVRPEFYTPVRSLLKAIFNSPHAIIVSCRERDYDECFKDHAVAFTLQGLHSSEIEGFLKRVVEENGKHQFYDSDLDKKILALAKNPFLLWLISILMRDNPEGLRLLGKRGRLFQEFILRMPRLRASEGIRANVPFDVVITALAKLGLEMQQAGRLTADLKDIRRWNIPTDTRNLEDILVQAKEWRFLKSDGTMGEQVEFLHQLFMEFFAAAYLDTKLLDGQSLTEVLGKLPFSNQWDEVIEMLAGITDKPAELVLWLNKLAAIKQQWHAAVLAQRCLVASRAIHDLHACLSVIRAPVIAPQDAVEIEDIRNIPEEVFEALGGMGDPRAVEPFFQLFINDGCDIEDIYFVESTKCRSLSYFVYPAAIKPLTKIFEEVSAEGNEENKGFLELVEDHLFLLHYLYNGDSSPLDLHSEADPLLALENTDAEVRRCAANILGETGDSKALPILEIMVREDKGRTLFGSVANAALKAIEKIKERHRL
jgi:hypothetical protein